ncbi:hypothetical protein SAMN04487895_107289 [Paenibacillus sophorae]|uniref:Uncharacterized protein n=1 Tax=Paenibacillus sophorae TaxID=1333845 RepID=A0A1H8PPW3_9BACL|nr:hypothetical protein SAMN04487895_107289 [Paenibacillus sophorae]
MKNAGNARMRVLVGIPKMPAMNCKLHAVTAPVPRRGFEFNGVAGNRQVSWLPSVLPAPSQEPLPALQVALGRKMPPVSSSEGRASGYSGGTAADSHRASLLSWASCQRARHLISLYFVVAYLR